MDAQIQMLSNESGLSSEKDVNTNTKKLYEDIKVKKKNVTDTEKKLAQTPHHGSHVTCHMSRFRCQVSRVTCQISDVTCCSFVVFRDKVVELVGGGSVIKEAYSV